MRRAGWATLAFFVVACSKPEASPPATGTSVAVALTPPTSSEACPATGLWAECSLLYRLERSGFVPKVDSSAKPAEKALKGKPLVVIVGRGATLELYIYSDSAARVADEAKLDRAHLVNATGQQTIERERTLIESSNVIGLLTSLSSHQRERVSDALMAGPPQAKKP